MRGKEEDGSRDFVGPSDAIERALSADRFTFRASHFVGYSLGIDEPRSDDIDEDIMRSQSLRQRLAHGVEAGFACAVGWRSRFTAKGSARRDVDDPPPLASALFDHPPRSAIGNIGRAEQIRGYGPIPGALPVFVISRCDRVRFEDRCIIDQDVQSLMAFIDLIDQPFGLIGIGDVGLVQCVFTTDRGHCSVRLFSIAMIVDGNPGTAGGELIDDFSTYPFSSAGDEDDFAGEIELRCCIVHDGLPSHVSK